MDHDMAEDNSQHPKLMDQEIDPDVSLETLLRSLKLPQTRLLSLEEWETQNPAKTSQSVSYGMSSSTPRYSNPAAAVLFHDLCNKNGKVPIFEYTESTQSAFTCTVSCQGAFKISSPQVFSTKKAAKHHICEQALSEVTELFRGAKTVAEQPAFNMKGENWVWTLQRYFPQEASTAARIVYTETTQEVHGAPGVDGIARHQFLFRAVVEISSCPGKIFGSTTALFPSKDAAKQNAAKDAALFLRSLSNEAPQAEPPMDVSQRLVQAATSLGVQNPAWNEKPAESPDGSSNRGWWYMAARFLPQDAAKDGRLCGDVGSVGPVFGRQNAKKAAAKAVLDVLQQIVSEQSQHT